ncbi:MAG: hypothetical protein FJ206_08880 [Gemmatimonadetes bacterium]|nr:hypothetical protein [Gemmatimonadota bacterium]
MIGLPEWAEVSAARARHIERVVALIERWIVAMAIPEAEAVRWRRAGWLHDALRDAPEATLRRLAGDHGPRGLLHGPAAATRAMEAGERDPGVLAAVRWHTVGSADWDWVGKVLYCADFLEPGRTHQSARRTELADRFPADPDGVLFRVGQWRIERLIEAGWQLPEATWRFWNALPRSGGST